MGPRTDRGRRDHRLACDFRNANARTAPGTHGTAGAAHDRSVSARPVPPPPRARRRRRPRGLARDPRLRAEGPPRVPRERGAHAPPRRPRRRRRGNRTPRRPGRPRPPADPVASGRGPALAPRRRRDGPRRPPVALPAGPPRLEADAEGRGEGRSGVAALPPGDDGEAGPRAPRGGQRWVLRVPKERDD